MKSVKVIVSGRVQGVWYRAWTKEQAILRGLSGWVRNRTDGTVEAVFSGNEQTVADMIAACRQGPPLALVYDITEEDADEPESGFVTLPTL